MIRFDWNRIKVMCNRDAPTIVLFLRYCIGLKIRKRVPLKLKNKKIPRGLSFIKNLEGLLEDKSASPYDIVQYIELCSRRNYVDYKFNKLLYLQSEAAYDNNVQYNRLITVNDRKIYFKYETERK